MAAIGLRLVRFAPSAIDRQLRYAFYSMLAILVALVFLFPLYWGLSTSLRTPIETFTVAGFGIPWIHFTPTLDNWADQLQVPETQNALINSSLIASCATLLALLLGTPAAYALARFRFELVAEPRSHHLLLLAAGAAAGRDGDPVLPGDAHDGPPGHPSRPDPGQRDLHHAVRGGDPAPGVPRPAGRARGIGADRRRRSLGRLLADRAAAGRAGDRGHGADHLRPRLERVPVRARDRRQGRDHRSRSTWRAPRAPAASSSGTSRCAR